MKAAIGQTVSHEDLGGAQMHAAVSGTIDFREPDEPTCLERLRRLVELLPADRADVSIDHAAGPADGRPAARSSRASRGRNTTSAICLPCLLDAGPFDEYKAEYGQTLVCGYGRLGGVPVGVVANQRKRCKPADGAAAVSAASSTSIAPTRRPASSWTATRRRLPLLFLQDVNGFMVGRDSEQAGIIRAGAKLVNVIANSVVPKLTVILGGSFGAGNYALCGKAFDPRFIFAWPTARYAVMGGEQAAEHAAGHHRQRPAARTATSRTRRSWRSCAARWRRATRSRPTSATRRPGCGWTRSSSRRRRARRC